MPENHPTTQHSANACDLNYSNPASAATPSFTSIPEKLCAEITQRGPISFPDFLDIALYDPQLGYYAKQTQQVGRDGDFYTSVSVGPLFGQLLARRFFKWWQDQGKPDSWRILEIGAHDAKLAADILATIASLCPQAWNQLEYAIVEPLPLLRESQIQKLTPLAAKLNITADFDSLPNAQGIAFANEILDALPFHLIRRNHSQWQELFVTHPLAFKPKPIDPTSALGVKTSALGAAFPEDYQTEIRTNYGAFLKQISRCIEDGLLLFIDYGFAAPEYYDPHRTRGTLRTFSKHQAAEDPLDRPGEIDITAHVDFTDLAREAQPFGWAPIHFSSQGSYLTQLATEMIQKQKLGTPKDIAQFRTLTHPGHLGASFHVIEFSKSSEPPPLVAHRLALS